MFEKIMPNIAEHRRAAPHSVLRKDEILCELESMRFQGVPRMTKDCNADTQGTCGSWNTSYYVYWAWFIELWNVRISCETSKKGINSNLKSKQEKDVGLKHTLTGAAAIWQIVLKCFPQTSRKQVKAAGGDGVAISSNKKFSFPSGLSQLNLCLWECDSIYKCT